MRRGEKRIEEEVMWCGMRIVSVAVVWCVLAVVVGGCEGFTLDTDAAVTTKVHIIEITPNSFNWSTAAKRDYRYQASLLELPDLPGWLTYRYSSKHEAGFLFGVPPSPSSLQLEVVALNRDTYETKRKLLHLNVTPIPEEYRARHNVELKIDNVNVEDMVDRRRVKELCDVITRVLWPESTSTLYMTFLASALTLGARLPLRPHDGEGVVVHLGSRASPSERLLQLEEEVSPLWKLPTCPRDYRRASVDRHFRQAGFSLDWCSFRLRKVDEEIEPNDRDRAGLKGDNERGPLALGDRASLPSREYSTELTATIISPLSILIIMFLLLSFILCFHHDVIEDSDSEAFFNSVFLLCENLCRKRERERTSEGEGKLLQYEAVQRATSTLRSLSNNRQSTSLLPNKPVQLVEEDTSRPSPPPYGATRRLLQSGDS